MATKKRTSPPASVSTKKQSADAALAPAKEKKFNTAKRKVRAIATTEEVKRANYIITRATRMKAAKLLYSNRWDGYERTWKMLEDVRPDDEKWRANLPDTFAYSAIKTAQSAFIDSEVVPIFSKNQDEDLMRATDMRDLYKDIARKGDLRMHLYLVRLDAMKLGTGFLFTYYEKDTKIRWDIDSFDPDSEKIIYTRKEVNDFDDPKTVRLSPYLVLVDEQTRSDFKGTCRDAIVLEILSRDEAKLKYGHMVGGDDAFDQRVPNTNNIRSVSAAEIGNKGIATTANNNTRDVRANTYTFFAPVELAEDMVEVMHYFCERPEDSYEILINGNAFQVKTNFQPSPIPYIHKKIPLTPVRYSLYSGDEFWGAGILEVTNADVKASRQNREMMNDRQRISLFSPVFSDVTDEIDQKLLKLKPLSIIRTRGGVPHQYKIPGITSADLQMGADLQASIKRASGIDENLLGGGAGSANLHRYTATAVSFIRQMAYMRLKDFEFLYKMALIDEVRLKLKLFEQYYSSPIKQAPHLTEEKGLTELAAKAKEFSVLTGDVYVKKAVSSTLFTGAIEDIDLDMSALVPLTPAELITKWSQVIRDMTPFVQSGILDLDMEKIATEYLSALEVNINTIRKDPDSEAISMADGEHSLLTNANTSELMYTKILKDGTPDQFLTAAHLKRHQQLLSTNLDPDIQKSDLKNLVAHIAKDTQNYLKKMKEQAAKAAPNMDKFSSNPMTPNIGAPDSGSGGKAPSVSMNYKDAPEDVQRQIEEALGYTPSAGGAPADTGAGGKPAPKINARGTGSGVRQPPSNVVPPLLGH